MDNESRLVPGVGRIPFPAYKGTEPYMFISYAHDDHEIVFPIIKRFHEQGYHVWYDEGIAPGNEWTDEIADALEGCSLFLVFMSPRSEASTNCRDEIGYAIDEKKPFLAIHIEETTLTGGLRLRVGTKQAILKYNMSDEEFEYKYTFAFENLGLPVPDFIRENREQNAYSREKSRNIEAGDLGGSSISAAGRRASGIKGTAVIRTAGGTTYTDVPALSIYSRSKKSLTQGPAFTLDRKALPTFREITKYTAENFGDRNDYHKNISISSEKGQIFSADVQTAHSYIGFLCAEKKLVLEWKEITEIDIDWLAECMDDWPGYARIHKKNGEMVFVPDCVIELGMQKRPAENQLSFNENYNFSEKINTERGTAVSLHDISSISFGDITYEKDRWKDDWFGKLPVGVLFRDGRILESYAKEDWFAVCAIDDFGPIEVPVADISHIDFVSNLQEEVYVPGAPSEGGGARTAGAEPETPKTLTLSDMPDPEAKYAEKTSSIGDFVPRGTVEISMKDGSVIRGVANSFFLLASGMEPGNRSNEFLYSVIAEPKRDGEDTFRNSVPMNEVVSVRSEGDTLLVTDIDDETTEIRLPAGSYFCFIGEDKKPEPVRVRISEAASVVFRRDESPDFPVRMCTVYCTEGYFRTPAAFIAVKYNASGSGIPSMKYRFDFDSFAGFPVSARNALMIEVTKNGSRGNMFAPPEDMELRAFIRTGEVVDFTMGGYFNISALGANGILRDLTRETTKCIDFRVEEASSEEDFQIDGGLLKSYTGKEMDLVLPPSVTIVSSFSFKDCRDFIETVDLKNTAVVMVDTFTDCPRLRSVRIPKGAAPVYGFAFKNCPELTLYIRRSQMVEGFEESFGGKEIVILGEDE